MIPYKHIFCIRNYGRHKNKHYWELMESMYYNIGNYTVKVPKGFILDMISIPKILHWISHPLNPELGYSGILHDWLYSCKYKGNITRKEADLIFYNQIKEHSIIKAILFYTAVRLFGWINYKKPLPFDKNNIT